MAAKEPAGPPLDALQEVNRAIEFATTALAIERDTTVRTPNGTVARKVPMQAATLREAAAILRCSVEDVRLVADEGGVARHLAFDRAA